MEIKGPTAPLTLRQQAPIPVERAKLPPDKLELEKLRLRKATREFESFFLASMLKSMRATVPKISGDEQKAENGLGKEIYQDMFDGELAKKMAERSSGGIGEILYNTLVRRIELKRPSDAKTMSHSETTRDSANMSDGTRVEQKHE